MKYAISSILDSLEERRMEEGWLSEVFEKKLYHNNPL